jgi:hypothetical protein
MAVIELSRRLSLLLLLCALSASAQQSRAIREQVAHVASALSAGHPAEAMDPFDKSFADYAKLRDYFTALTDAHTIINEMDITDEQIDRHEATLTIHWILTLQDLTTGRVLQSRSTQVKVAAVAQQNSDAWSIENRWPAK